MLASFDVGPFQSSDINGPPWVGLLAGVIFMAGGIAVMLGDGWRDSVLVYGLSTLIIGALAWIANWIAFGPGPRECEMALAGVWFHAESWANGLSCRAGFGIGAGLLDGVVLWVLAAALRNIGSGAPANLVEKLAIALLLLSLSPLIVPLLLFVIAKSCLEAFATWCQTGQWPRNDSFIARMKTWRARQS